MNNNGQILLAITFMMSLLSACSAYDKAPKNKTSVAEESTDATKPLVDNVRVAIEQAKANADYRLLHSKGRRMVLPGLEQHDLSLLKSQCGVKPMLVSGDVLKTAEQRQQRKVQYEFAKQFNQAVYAMCLESLNSSR